MTRPALIAAVVSMGLTGAAFAQQPPPAKVCRVQVESRAAGIIEVAATSQAIPPAPPRVVWQPVASGPGVMLLVYYGEGSLAHMDEPEGLFIRFRTPGARADSLSVQIRSSNGRAWRFDGASIVTEPDNLAHIAFGLDWPYGRGVLAAIAENRSLTISVEQDGQVLNSAGFGLSNIEARDTLLAEARSKAKGLDVSACAPTAPTH